MLFSSKVIKYHRMKWRSGRIDIDWCDIFEMSMQYARKNSRYTVNSKIIRKDFDTIKCEIQFYL